MSIIQIAVILLIVFIMLAFIIGPNETHCGDLCQDVKWCEENGGRWIDAIRNGHCSFAPEVISK